MLRHGYNLGRNAGADAEGIDSARATRRLFAAAEAAAPRRRGRGGGPRAMAPDRAEALWQPLGPAVTLRGSGDSDPRVAGRVRDIAVNDDGTRIYVASALGGVWYSGDSGASWEPVGKYATTVNRADLAQASNTLANGAIHVRFDAGGNLANDEVWVGTGEPDTRDEPSVLGFQGQYGGVGVLHARGPVQAVRANGNTDPWTREAQPRPGVYRGLRGAGVFSIVADPRNADHLVAATTRGLHERDPLTGDWSVVQVAQWNATTLTSDRVVVTDVVWTTVGANSRLWVAAASGSKAQLPAVRGLWRSDNGTAGPWVRVDLTGVKTNPQRGTLRRIGLAAAPSDGAVVYALANGPRLWRVDGDTTVRRVRAIPAALFGGAGSDQSEYDLAIAVDPREPRRLVLGGSFVNTPGDSTLVSAALYRITLRGTLPATGANWPTDYGFNEGNDATWVGSEVHPDVHRIRWPSTGAAPGHVFVGCDGGLFRSTDGAGPRTFASRASGLQVNEPGFLAPHPTNDSIVLVGVQDNGVQMRIGESVWRRALLFGDGGGVAFDPGRPDRFAAQPTQSSWGATGDVDISPTWRGTDPNFQVEDARSTFYSNAAVLRRADNVTQLAIGTNRVWYSENWGSKVWTGAAFATSWRTLPSRTDPRAADAANFTTDVLPPGPFPPGSIDRSPGVRALRWSGEHRLYAVMPGAIYRLERTPATMSWRLRRVHIRSNTTSPMAAAVGPSLAREGSLNDIAPHDNAAGPHGSFYLATSHPLEPLWFFDGTNTWYPCGLGTLPPPPPVPANAPDGVRAPAYSVVVDPANTEVVYAGTTVGVWRGERSVVGGAPQWHWTAFNNGLPEAAVQDLAISTYPLPQGGNVRLMRAALQARGVWELQLDVPTSTVTYVRAHHYDTRRMRPVPLADPMFRAGSQDRVWHLDWADVRNRDFRAGPAAAAAPHPDGTPAGSFLWHASPDIKVRPAPGSTPLAPPAAAPAGHSPLPWTNLPDDRFALWALQTALHGLDPRVVPDGRWTVMLRRRIRALRESLGVNPAGDRVDADLWNHPQVQAQFWADPWDVPGAPTEADLMERIVGMATPRPGSPTGAAVSPASVALPAQRAKVEVCVHGRGLAAAAPSEVAVALLRFQLPVDPLMWGAPLLATVSAVTSVLVPLMQAAPAGGAALPALPGGWVAADAVVGVRRPGAAVSAASPAVLTFDTDFTGAAGTRWLLLAVVFAGVGTPDLTGAVDLRDAVLRSPHLAARSVEIV
jgi:hypothetical protein